jgi:hypothetical protein
MNGKEISDIQLQKQMEQQGTEGGELGAEGGGLGPAEISGGEEGAPEGEEGAPEGEGEAETADTDLSGENKLNEALVNVLGKDFLVENNEDFFRLMKFVKDSKKPKAEENTYNPLMERVSDIIRTPVRDTTPINSTPSLRKQMILGEMKGLTYQAGSRYMKLYENVNGDFKEKEILLND